MSKLIFKQDVIEFINRDCKLHGHGRKKWWAENLGVSSMTLSHWLVGRRQPSAKHLENIHILCESVFANNEKSELADSLWQAYYDKKELPAEILKAVCEKLLKSGDLQTRLIALLSYLFEQSKPAPYHEPPVMNSLRNRLGWLYESANLDAGFKPAKIETTQLLELSTAGSGEKKVIKKYLSAQQTELGGRWRVYDCSLDDLKSKLDWQLPA